MLLKNSEQRVKRLPPSIELKHLFLYGSFVKDTFINFRIQGYMRFGLIYYGMEPRNRGLDQLAQTLLQLGHKAFIVCRASKSGAVVNEFNGTPVIVVPGKKWPVKHLFNIPVPFNRFWTWWLVRLGQKYQWDGIFVRETPLSLETQAAGRKLGIPMFLDMRENILEMYAAGSRKKWYRKILRPRGLIRWYEDAACSRSNFIFTVTDELGNWVTQTYNVDKNKVGTLGNYPSKIFLRQAEQTFLKKSRRSVNQPLRLIHTGSIMENRGLQDIIRAIKILHNRGNPVELRIIGEGSYTDELKRLTGELEIEKHVEFIPMLPPQEVAQSLADGDIGVCAYLLNLQAHQTLPGKLFEYMAAGLPVISSARKPVVRIIEKEKCGMIYPSREPQTIADALAFMLCDPMALVEMAKRARDAVFKRYNQNANLKILREALRLSYMSEDNR